MAKIRVIEVERGRSKGFHVIWKRERLSGPFKTREEAFEATKEWIAPNA